SLEVFEEVQRVVERVRMETDANRSKEGADDQHAHDEGLAEILAAQRPDEDRLPGEVGAGRVQFLPDQSIVAGGHEERELVIRIGAGDLDRPGAGAGAIQIADRKSTRLNSSHVAISYAVFCLKKKKKKKKTKIVKI